MLGPEANHFILVSHADHFRWRDGAFGDLIPLLGDGMLTIDGDFHRRSRRIMLPAFHRERIAAAHGAIATEVERARRAAGTRARAWTSTAGHASWRCASRCGRCSGSTPTAGRRAWTRLREFERALSFFGREYVLQILRGPRTPFAQMMAARAPARRTALRRDRAPPAQRRARRGPAQPAARRARRGRLGAQRGARARPPDDDAVRRPRHDDGDRGVPVLRARPRARSGTRGWPPSARRSGASRRPPTSSPAPTGRCPCSSRRSRRRCASTRRRGSARAARAARSSSRATRSRAARSSTTPRGRRTACPTSGSARTRSGPSASRPEARKRIPRGAYVPFGGGSRICIGMRFGQLEIRTIAARVLRDFRLELAPGFRLAIRQTPTLGPRAGLPVVVKARE